MSELIAESLARLRSANRIDGTKASYRKDNPIEYEKVIAYLDGGARPSDVVTDMGVGLVLAEDARRSLTEPEPPPPVASFDIPHWRVTLPVSNTAVARWRLYRTDNNSFVTDTPHLATPAPNPRNPTGPRSWTWWLLGSTTIPTSFPGGVSGSFATIDPHTSQYDVGPSGMGGIGWGFGSGVAGMHIFYLSNHPVDGHNKFILYADYNSGTNKWVAVANVEKGKRYDFCAHVILGRVDQQLGLAGPGISGGGIGDHPNGGAGRIRLYVDGALVVDTGNINTLQRATAPDSKTYTQTLWYRPWDGTYVVPRLTQQITMDRTVTRVGTTLSEALGDGAEGFDPPSEWENGSTTNLAPLRSSEFHAPSAP